MAAIDTVVAGALDRATDGFLTHGEVIERLTAEAGIMDPGSYDRTHLDTLRAAVCFRLAVDGSFTVSGPLETFANAGGVHVARALLAEFSANLAKLLAEQRTAAAPPAADTLPSAPADAMLAPTPPGATSAPAPTAARELSATSLLWRAFLSWLRDLAGKGERPR